MDKLICNCAAEFYDADCFAAHTRECKHSASAAGSVAGSNTLPGLPGFYWWRDSDEDDWRMVQIMDLSGRKGSLRLYAYDVEKRSFGGRPLRAWEDPIGEWIECLKPNAKIEASRSDCLQ